MPSTMWCSVPVLSGWQSPRRWPAVANRCASSIAPAFASRWRASSPSPGDVTDPAFAASATRGAQVVYQALNPPYHRWAQEFPGLQAAAIAAAQAAGARLVVVDNVYMYGRANGWPFTENRASNAHTRKGRVRADMAGELMAAHNAGRVQVTVGRASDFFGPRAGEQSLIGDWVIPPALAGKTASVMGDPDMPHTYTFIPDIGENLVQLGERDDAADAVAFSRSRRWCGRPSSAGELPVNRCPEAPPRGEGRDPRQGGLRWDRAARPGSVERARHPPPAERLSRRVPWGLSRSQPRHVHHLPLAHMTTASCCRPRTVLCRAGSAAFPGVARVRMLEMWAEDRSSRCRPDLQRPQIPVIG
jgi:hypothetical protein